MGNETPEFPRGAREVNNCTVNTDREIWCENADDICAPRVHVTHQGHIGMNIAGRVIVLDIRTWHWLGEYYCKVMPELPYRAVEKLSR